MFHFLPAIFHYTGRLCFDGDGAKIIMVSVTNLLCGIFIGILAWTITFRQSILIKIAVEHRLEYIWYLGLVAMTFIARGFSAVLVEGVIIQSVIMSLLTVAAAWIAFRIWLELRKARRLKLA